MGYGRRMAQEASIPDFVRDGFHMPLSKPDLRVVGRPQLSKKRPAVGQYVKVNVNFSKELRSELDVDPDPVTWAILSGDVVEVLSPKRVVAVVDVTTVPTAMEMFPEPSGRWR